MRVYHLLTCAARVGAAAQAVGAHAAVPVAGGRGRAVQISHDAVNDGSRRGGERV